MMHRDDVPSRSIDTPVRRVMRVGGLVFGCAAVAVAAIIGSGTQLVGPPVASAEPKPTATVSGAADPGTNWKWYQKIGGPYTTMDDALKAWSSAMGAGNTDAMHAACGQIRQAGAQFQGLLPGPDSRANFRIQGIANDLYTAADRCQALPPGANWDTAKDMISEVNSARSRLKSVKSIMAPYG